jgi:hypothetical protein
MAKTAKRSSDSGNIVKAKELVLRVDEVLADIENQLLALQDLGAKMKDCPFIGYTMQECILSLTEKVRVRAAQMPTPTDPKAAKPVRALLREGQAALDAMDDGAELLSSDFDQGMKGCRGAEAFGVGIENLAVKAGAAFESAAASMGADKAMFCFPKQALEAA